MDSMPRRNVAFAGNRRVSFSNPPRSMEHVMEKIFSSCSPIPHASNFSFDTSIPTKQFITNTSRGIIRKTGVASGQSSIVTRAHKAQSTYHGSKRQGTDCTEGSATQEVVSPPAFLGANLTCL